MGRPVSGLAQGGGRARIWHLGRILNSGPIGPDPGFLALHRQFWLQIHTAMLPGGRGINSLFPKLGCSQPCSWAGYGQSSLPAYSRAGLGLPRVYI